MPINLPHKPFADFDYMHFILLCVCVFDHAVCFNAVWLLCHVSGNLEHCHNIIYYLRMPNLQNMDIFM